MKKQKWNKLLQETLESNEPIALEEKLLHIKPIIQYDNLSGIVLVLERRTLYFTIDEDSNGYGYLKAEIEVNKS